MKMFIFKDEALRILDEADVNEIPASIPFLTGNPYMFSLNLPQSLNLNENRVMKNKSKNVRQVASKVSK